jgi:hypothetical protein
MGIKHEDVKASGERGLASEWNKDHVIDGDVDFDKNQLLSAAVENRTTWPVGPVAGQIIYRTDLGTSYVWNGSAWVAASGAPRTATVVVAAIDSLDVQRADYVCDGTADEVQINAAIAALPATGGCVLMLEGTYTIADAIMIDRHNTTLQGQGKSTKIMATNLVGPNIAAVTVDSVNYAVIRDMQIKFSAVVYAGVYLVSANYPLVNNVLVEGFLYGLVTDTVVGAIVTGCVGQNNIYSVWADTMSLSIISENNMRGAINGIYMLNNCDRNSVTNNQVESSITIADASCDHNLVHGNITGAGVSDGGTSDVVANNI